MTCPCLSFPSSEEVDSTAPPALPGARGCVKLQSVSSFRGREAETAEVGNSFQLLSPRRSFAVCRVSRWCRLVHDFILWVVHSPVPCLQHPLLGAIPVGIGLFAVAHPGLSATASEMTERKALLCPRGIPTGMAVFHLHPLQREERPCCSGNEVSGCVAFRGPLVFAASSQPRACHSTVSQECTKSPR